MRPSSSPSASSIQRKAPPPVDCIPVDAATVEVAAVMTAEEITSRPAPEPVRKVTEEWGWFEDLNLDDNSDGE